MTEFGESWERFAMRHRVAAEIAKAPTKAARQMIWNHVPPQWRELVGYSVALLLGANIGAMPRLVDRRAALAEVPDELLVVVERECARVYWQLQRSA